MNPSDYIHTQGIKYEHSNAFGYTDMPILEFLIGGEWDEIALAFVGALHPSNLRVVRGEETCDSCLGRVTIYVDKDMLITGAHQEVRVDLPRGIDNGYELQNALKARPSGGYKHD